MAPPASGFRPKGIRTKQRGAMSAKIDLRLPRAKADDAAVVPGHEDVVGLAAVRVGEVIVVRVSLGVDELRRAFLLLRIEVEGEALVEALELGRRRGRLAVARPDDAARLRLRRPL